MTAADNVPERRKEHKLVLTDDVWSEVLVQGVLEEKTASDICEYVLDHYVSLAEPDRPQKEVMAASGNPRSVYLAQSIWLKLMICKVREKRPISAILEQQLRTYLGLSLP